MPAACHAPSSNSLVTTIGGGDFLIGNFTHRDGSRYVMVVNKDLTKSRACWPQFCKSPKRLRHICAYSGALTSYEGEYVWLAPGQGILIRPE